MAHELEFRDGKASFFSVNETPWHREGHILTAAPSLDEAIAVANLDYKVEKRPTMFQCITPDGDTFAKVSKTAFVTVRTDTQQELGAVGPTYQPVQNTDAFRVLEPLLDNGIATLETGGVLREGGDAWLMVKWDLSKFGPTTQEVFGNEVLPFGLIANNHNGRRGILLMDTNIRVVCANTLGFAERSKERRYVIKHSSIGMERLISAAQDLWHGVVERYEVLAAQYANLREFMLTQDEFKTLVLDVLAPDPREDKSFDPKSKLAETVVARADEKRQFITSMWTGGRGHSGEPSAWFAYNAAVETLDHNRDLFPNRGGVTRTTAMIEGGIRKMKDEVLEGLVALATTA